MADGGGFGGAGGADLKAFDELAELDLWVGWQPEVSKGRALKVPYDPKPRRTRRAKTNNRNTWGTRAQAQGWVAQARPVGGGIGINLGDLGDGRYLAGVDFDACLGGAGNLAPWAAPILAGIDSYIEVSPRGNGIKAFFYAESAAIRPFLDAIGADPDKWGRSEVPAGEDGSNHGPKIEVFTAARFFTVTGRRSGDNATINSVDKAKLDALAAVLNAAWGERKSKELKSGKSGKSGGEGRDNSRSARAFREIHKLRRRGVKRADAFEAMRNHPDQDIRDWVAEVGDRGLQRAWGADPPPAGVGDDWYRDCQSGSDGRTLGNLFNAELALRRDPAWSDVLAYDELAANIVLRRPIPSSAPEDDDRSEQKDDDLGAAPPPFVKRPITDNDLIRAQQWLQFAGLKTIGKDAAADAIDLVAKKSRFHPVRDCLDDLKWDGVERLPTWLSEYLGAARNEYTAAVGRLFLITMVARIYQPGCKADHMMILQGPQGIGKSTACRVLAGDAYFSDAIPENLASKDTSQHMRGKWLIEVAELNSFNKTDATALKSILTRPDEIYRPPYGRHEVREPRQCVFIGTTNADSYLRDPTGGRRFWPVSVGKIDIERLRADRDQLFAEEAVVRFQAGERWWPRPDFEERVIAPEQEARYEYDAWEDLIASYLGRPGTVRVTVHRVADDALHIDRGRLDRSAQMRIAAALKRLGWERTRSHGNSWWERPSGSGSTDSAASESPSSQPSSAGATSESASEQPFDFTRAGATGATSSSNNEKLDPVESEVDDTRTSYNTTILEKVAPVAPDPTEGGNQRDAWATPTPTPGQCDDSQGGFWVGGARWPRGVKWTRLSGEEAERWLYEEHEG